VGLDTGSRRPALDRHINIGRIDIEPAEAPPGPLGCHERGSRAQKKIKHQIAAPGHILDRIGNQCACRKSNSHIQMVKSAEEWRLHNAANGMNSAR